MTSPWWSSESQAGAIAGRPDVQQAIASGSITGNDWWNQFGQNEAQKAEQGYAQQLNAGAQPNQMAPTSGFAPPGAGTPPATGVAGMASTDPNHVYTPSDPGAPGSDSWWSLAGTGLAQQAAAQQNFDDPNLIAYASRQGTTPSAAFPTASGFGLPTPPVTGLAGQNTGFGLSTIANNGASPYGSAYGQFSTGIGQQPSNGQPQQSFWGI